MSLTLSIPPAIVQAVKAYADERGTTISRLTRDFYLSLTSRTEVKNRGAADRFFDIVKKAKAKAPGGYRFNREELHVRGAAK